MSEEAFYWQHKQEYGVYPDEDGGPDPDMKGYDFRCPKCNEPSFDSEKGSDGLCINCSANADSPEHERAAEVKGQATVFVHESYCSGSNISLQNLGAGRSQLYCHGCNQFIPIMQQFGKLGSEAHAPLAPQAPSATPSGEALRERGIKRVSSNNKEWMQSCIDRWEWYSRGWPATSTFTGEDIRHNCEHYGTNGLHPTHPNAWGGLINALVRKGLIKATGVYVTPKDHSSHARKIKQYVRV